MNLKTNLYSISQRAELKALAENIRLARKRRKMSRADLAQRVGSSMSTIVRLESADPTVAIGTVFQVLDILGLLQGISKITDPENDIVQVLNEVRDLRLKNRRTHKPAFSKEELEF